MGKALVEGGQKREMLQVLSHLLCEAPEVISPLVLCTSCHNDGT